MPGTLYLVGTPIGNLEDLSLRARRVLGEVAVIAAEDTRVTQKLLARYELSTPLMSYHEHSGPRRREEIITLVGAGKDVALVSDAGMPGISDPGAALVRECVAAGLPVTAIPGPTAVTTALALSGFPAQGYDFLGFLPARAKARREALESAAGRPGVIVCFEAPHRLLESLTEMREALGDREALCARELTKQFEEIVRGRLTELCAHFAEHSPRGEMTVVIAPAPRAEPEASELAAGVEEAKELIAAGLAASRAAAHVAKWRGLSRRAVYQAVIGHE